MMHFKNHKAGFTLVEVMIALVVFAIAIGPLLLQQGASLRTIARASHQWQRFSTALHYLTSTAMMSIDPRNPTLTVEKKNDDPAMTMKFTALKVADSSVVGKYKNLYVQKVEYQWQDSKGVHKDTVQQLVVLPEVKKQ